MSPENIKIIEDMKKANYVGYYDLRNGNPVDVFYVAEPDRSLGHSNYFGLYHHPLTKQLMICDAQSVTEAQFAAILLENGEYLVSGYRHDYVTGPRGEMLDGGPIYDEGNYNRWNIRWPPTHIMTIVDGKKVYTEREKVE